MRIVDCGPALARSLAGDAWGSRGAAYLRLARGPEPPAGRSGTDLMYFGPDSVLGRHPAGPPQLFVVVAGAGWVSGTDGVRQPIQAGQAAYWEPGESHESGSAAGMTVVIVQSDASVPGSVAGDLRAGDPAVGPAVGPHEGSAGDDERRGSRA